MGKIAILDCTLRDGGYYTNWDFDKALAESYFKACNKLPVEYIEIGYRSLPQKDYLGEYFYCPDCVLENVRRLSEKKLSIMLNEKDVRPEHVPALLHSAQGKIDLIRLAVDPNNMLRAVKLAEEIKKFNFKVGFNVMYMSKWQDQPGFLANLKSAKDVMDYFYMVDSYGGVSPKNVIEAFNLVKERVDVPIGFHGHNNMEMGLINSLTAIGCGAEMIDATVTGMGRGAGNLKTELLLTALNAQGKLDIDFNALSDLTQVFETLQEKYKWGTSLPYMVSGANSLPQKDVMDWVGKRFYSYNSIIRALQNQKNKVEDNERFEKFSPEKHFSTVLIIGGGPSLSQHMPAIRAFINTRDDLALIHASARNAALFKGIRCHQYFCLVGNEGNRLEKAIHELGVFSGECLLPAFPRKMGTYVPPMVLSKTRELKEIEFSPILKDAHTALALQASLQLGAKEIYVAGYDGYGQTAVSSREFELFSENEFLFANFKKHTSLWLHAITPTVYKELKADSVYAKI